MSNIFGTNTTSDLMSVAETAQKIMQGNSLTEDWLEGEMYKVQHKWPKTNPKIKQQWLKKITARAEKEGMDMSAGGEFEERLRDFGLTIHAGDKVWTEASKIKSKWKKMSTAERTRWIDKLDDLARKHNTSEEDVRAIRDEFGLHMSEEVEVSEGIRDFKVGDTVKFVNDDSDFLGQTGKITSLSGNGISQKATVKLDKGGKSVTNVLVKVDLIKEEVAEGWKKGKYTIKDENGKILGTYSSGGKAKKVMDDLMQKGDYPELTVSMVEEVEVAEKFAGWIAIYGGKQLEIKKSEADGIWPAKQLAIKHFKVPKSKQGLLAIKPAEEEVELGEAASKYKNEFVKYAVEIIKKLKKDGKIDDSTKDSLIINTISPIMGSMGSQRERSVYKKYFPDKYDLKLFDNSGGNQYDSEWSSQTDAKMDTIAKMALKKFRQNEEVELGEMSYVIKYKKAKNRYLSNKSRDVDNTKDALQFKSEKDAQSTLNGLDYQFRGNYEIVKEASDSWDEWKNTRIQSKNIFRMLKQKHKNNIPKMKSGLELIFKQNKTKPDQEKVMWQEFNKFFKIKEDVELGEAASKYTIYHKTFTSAATHAKDYAEKQGYDLDDGDWNREVTMGGASGRGRPGEGKTKRFNIGLEKNGKPQKKRLQFQVFGMPKGSYELNMYIEEVELSEAAVKTKLRDLSQELSAYAKKHRNSIDSLYFKKLAQIAASGKIPSVQDIDNEIEPRKIVLDMMAKSFPEEFINQDHSQSKDSIKNQSGLFYARHGENDEVNEITTGLLSRAASKAEVQGREPGGSGGASANYGNNSGKVRNKRKLQSVKFAKAFSKKYFKNEDNMIENLKSIDKEIDKFHSRTKHLKYLSGKDRDHMRMLSRKRDGFLKNNEVEEAVNEEFKSRISNNPIVNKLYLMNQAKSIAKEITGPNKEHKISDWEALAKKMGFSRRQYEEFGDNQGMYESIISQENDNMITKSRLKLEKVLLDRKKPIEPKVDERAGEWGTDKLANTYRKTTPGQDVKEGNITVNDRDPYKIFEQLIHYVMGTSIKNIEDYSFYKIEETPDKLRLENKEGALATITLADVQSAYDDQDMAMEEFIEMMLGFGVKELTEKGNSIIGDEGIPAIGKDKTGQGIYTTDPPKTFENIDLYSRFIQSNEQRQKKGFVVN